MNPTLKSILSRTERQPNGCMTLGSPTPNRPYACVTVDGKTVNAHRAVWAMVHGQIPPGMCVCHSCDTTRCVNPDHLFLGTMADNMADRDSKGRNGTLGEDSPLAKLTASQVLEIRDRASSETFASLAVAFGVSLITIERIVYRQTWRHLAAQTTVILPQQEVLAID